MECLHPIVVKSTDGLCNYRLVPCGKCIACRARKASAWSLRVQNEASDSNSCYFITLTYTDDNLTYGDSLNATLVPSDLSAFIKRYRKYLTIHYDDKHTVRFSQRVNMVTVSVAPIITLCSFTRSKFPPKMFVRCTVLLAL